MAVEAGRMNICSPQLIPNRDLDKIQANLNTTTCNNQMNFGFPMNTTMTPDRFFPYGQSPVGDPTGKASDSGFTYYVNPCAPRKRPIDSPVGESDTFCPASRRQRSSCLAPLIDQDVISQIHQQQSEVDRFIAQHTEKLRMELEERRRRHSRTLTSAIQSAIAKKLKEKNEEIQRMGKLNWVLQERVRSLYVENQMWGDLAQTNEAAANDLRTNLEQVLAQAGGSTELHRASAAAADDAESGYGSCGSAGRDAEDEIDSNDCGSGPDRRRATSGRGGCRRCMEREASVLLLPCRHLCLCRVCGSSLLQACPVCETVMNGSVHINMS